MAEGRETYLEYAKARARLHWLEGALHIAVHSLIRDLDKWPELAPSELETDMGWVLADEGNEAAVRNWIEGF